MDSHCIPFAEIPQTSNLLADYLYDFSRVASFYGYDPFLPDSYRSAAPEAPVEETRRTTVADVLAEQNEQFGAGPETQENIARLRRGQALAVVTGQQVGLFGGPAYSVYKALTAIRLARKLTAEGIEAVPVFWLASEDHDLEEVNHATFLEASGELLPLRDSVPSGKDIPVGHVSFGTPIADLRQQVADLWPRELADEPQVLLAGYAPGHSYADAFARLFHRLFSGLGLVILDPLHPTFHALSRPLFRRALSEAEKLQNLIRQRSLELEQIGHHAQVRLKDNGTLVFMMVNGRRLPVRRRGNGFFIPGHGERSPEALQDQLESEPSRFSANVLLRPLMQDSLLPTVAYVAGPNEIAYFAQAHVLYGELLGRMPVIVPRTSLTVVDRRAQRLLRKYSVGLPECFRGRAALRALLAERMLPPRLLRRLERTEARIDRLLDETATEVHKRDPTLQGATDTSRRKMLYQFHKLRGKAARARAEREGNLERHLDILLNSLYPDRNLQERRLSFLNFVAREGRGLVPRLLEQLQSPCRDHQVIFL
jgi:bacillithiol biosynthesis cysteine-adding enzyme BshC